MAGLIFLAAIYTIIFLNLTYGSKKTLYINYVCVKEKIFIHGSIYIYIYDSRKDQRCRFYT